MQRHLLLLLLFSFLGNALLAQAAQPLEVAHRHLSQNLATLGLTDADIAEYEVRNQYISKHNKLTHLYLRQQYKGIPVHNAILNFNIKEDGTVLSTGNRFVGELEQRVNTVTPQLSMQEAVEKTLQAFDIPYAVAPQMVKDNGPHEAVFDPSGIALEPIPVQLKYQLLADGTVHLVWNVRVYQLDAQHCWNARIDAVSGAVLDYHDQVIHCNFGGTDDCAADGHTHTTSMEQPAFEMPLTTSGGEASYRVYPLTVESPNHGNRALVIDPADTLASPFGWHDIDGVEGAEYTITRGNNVHAYHDIFDTNMSFGGEPDGGDTLCFDFPLDLSSNQPYTQQDPIITNLFYWNNISHDMWYYYGFDEAAGNFQEINYTGEGEEGDYVRAQGLDGGGRNNANFFTPEDGERPRMQMYLWGDYELPNITFMEFEITRPDSLVGEFLFAPASFGPALPPKASAIEGSVVLVDDGEGDTGDGCQPFINAAEIEGNIAMMYRGTFCQDAFRVLAAQQAGAIAVIVCNSADPFPMGPGTFGDQVTIPSVMTRTSTCERILMGMPDTEIRLWDGAPEIPLPGPTAVTSDLDNGVIVHEYAHGISNRLTGGGSEVDCLRNFEQAGEGWSDWYALAMTTTSANNADEPRGIATYLVNEPTAGTGIRTYPYSRDMDVNPHTYADILNESRPHGIGSVFCVTLWDMYWNLVDVYGFDDDLYQGSGGNNIAMQLVTDGLKLQPCSPNFLEARDAILLADSVNYDGANTCLIWETFARRGIGESAQPNGQEAFDVARICNSSFSVAKTTVAEANAGDTLTYTLDILNSRPDSVENGVITDILPEGVTYLEDSATCDISETDGILTIDVGGLGSSERLICSYQVILPEDQFSSIALDDNFDPPQVEWLTLDGGIGGPVNWATQISNSFSSPVSYFGPNADEVSDQILMPASPITLTGPTPVLSFWHLYSFDRGADGGVIELNAGGQEWIDLGEYIVENGYIASLNTDTTNSLSGRLAFTDQSPDWVQTIVDLTPFVGQEVMIRFRMGTGEQENEEGKFGWYIDNVRVFSNLQVATNTACAEYDGEVLCDAVSTSVIEAVVTNTTEVPRAEVAFSVFPNPTKGGVTVALEGEGTAVQLRVFSVDGKLLRQYREDAFQRMEIDLTDLGKGMYLIQLQTDKGIATKRVVLQ